MTILDSILEAKRLQLPAIRAMAENLPSRRRPRFSLKERLMVSPCLAVIAEIKRASPSLGCFAPELNILSLARIYETSGAAAISVLTDPHFAGSTEDLRAVAEGCRIPVLAKDFILDPAQLAVADAAGADAVLLIAAALGPDQVRSLAHEARRRGLEVILELHRADDMALEEIPGEVILGFNSRDLRDFSTSVDHAATQLRQLGSPGLPVIAESGIRTEADARKLADAGFHGLLVGEGLIRSTDPGELLRALSSVAKGEAP